MYVVRRAFRNYGSMLVPGTTVEPEHIKRFRSRVNERDIIEVTDSTFDMWNEYFTSKFGTPLTKPEDAAAMEAAAALIEPAESAKSAEPAEYTAPVVAKATPKVVVKAT